MSKQIQFNLIEYSKFLPMFQEIDKDLKNKNEQDFIKVMNDALHLMSNTEHTELLDEDCLTGYKNGSIFINKKLFSKGLESEILRPITKRHIMCFKSCLYELENGKNRNAFAEIIDCFLDYGRSLKKKYISFSEYQLFETLMEIAIKKFNSLVKSNIESNISIEDKIKVAVFLGLEKSYEVFADKEELVKNILDKIVKESKIIINSSRIYLEDMEDIGLMYNDNHDASIYSVLNNKTLKIKDILKEKNHFSFYILSNGYEIAKKFYENNKKEKSIEVLRNTIEYHQDQNCIKFLFEIEPEYVKICKKAIQEVKKDVKTLDTMDPLIKSIILGTKSFIEEIAKDNQNILQYVSIDLKKEILGK